MEWGCKKSIWCQYSRSRTCFWSKIAWFCGILDEWTMKIWEEAVVCSSKEEEICWDCQCKKKQQKKNKSSATRGRHQLDSRDAGKPGTKKILHIIFFSINKSNWQKKTLYLVMKRCSWKEKYSCLENCNSLFPSGSYRFLVPRWSNLGQDTPRQHRTKHQERANAAGHLDHSGFKKVSGFEPATIKRSL